MVLNCCFFSRLRNKEVDADARCHLLLSQKIVVTTTKSDRTLNASIQTKRNVTLECNTFSLAESESSWRKVCEEVGLRRCQTHSLERACEETETETIEPNQFHPQKALTKTTLLFASTCHSARVANKVLYTYRKKRLPSVKPIIVPTVIVIAVTVVLETSLSTAPKVFPQPARNLRKQRRV